MSWMVYLCESPRPTVLPFGHPDPPLVAGSSSLRFTLSGMSFEGVAPTHHPHRRLTITNIPCPPLPLEVTLTACAIDVATTFLVHHCVLEPRSPLATHHPHPCLTIANKPSATLELCSPLGPPTRRHVPSLSPLPSSNFRLIYSLPYL